MRAPQLLSIQVGAVQSYGTSGAPNPMDQPWTTAIFKYPTDGPIPLSEIGLEGDAQADRRFHGGLDKAVLAYSADHYPSWRAELGRPDLPHGAFGENFTIAGLAEDTVCIGDIYTIGDVRVQVSQPRQPCWKLARRWRINSLTAMVKGSARGGWYLRVLVEGAVEPGLPVELVERPHPEWTVRRAFQVMQGRKEDRASAESLASCPLLSVDFREGLLS